MNTQQTAPRGDAKRFIDELESEKQDHLRRLPGAEPIERRRRLTAIHQLEQLRQRVETGGEP